LTPPVAQPVREAAFLDDVRREERPKFLRRAIAGPAGLALLLAGGGALVRAVTLAAQREGEISHGWLFTAAACLLAGVALVLITLPKIAFAEREGTEPTPVSHG
jgi:hypothetical protein